MSQSKLDPLFDPRCCIYKLNGETRNHIDRLISSDDVDAETKSILEQIMEEEEANKNSLVYDSLANLYKYIQRADPEFTDPFYVFSDSCKCIEPKPRENKQLDARLKILRLRSSQAMYNKMTASVDRKVEDKMNQIADNQDQASQITSNIYSSLSNNSDNNIREDGQTHLSEFRKLNGSVVAVFNSFLVFICTFVFCYKALEYGLPRPNIIAQVLFGLGGSTIVAIAELYFLMRVV